MHTYVAKVMMNIMHVCCMKIIYIFIILFLTCYDGNSFIHDSSISYYRCNVVRLHCHSASGNYAVSINDLTGVTQNKDKDGGVILTNNRFSKNRFLNNSTKYIRKIFISALVLPSMLGMFPTVSRGDDELAKYAAEGNKVGVDTTCFFRKCSLETAKCGNNPTCLKGLACLARCKGGSMCSTGCFSKHGSDSLDNLLYCSVEKNDCVQVPGKENVGWSVDKVSDLPGRPIDNFKVSSLDGSWYKVMGLDSRYDCFDCQKNTFQVKSEKTVGMEAIFRIPKPGGFMQNNIKEELHLSKADNIANMQSQGKMFGLTFWENWYILGESDAIDSKNSIIENSFPNVLPVAFAADTNSDSDLKLIYYTGHTLQGSYKGAFVYSRSPTLSSQDFKRANFLIVNSGLNPTVFCVIHNQCFLDQDNTVNGKDTSGASAASADDNSNAVPKNDPFWILGQQYFRVTRSVASELADWFEDPTLLSEWLVSQQERMVLQQPLAVSPFASLAGSGNDNSK